MEDRLDGFYGMNNSAIVMTELSGRPMYHEVVVASLKLFVVFSMALLCKQV